MDRKELYDELARRKFKESDYSYRPGNNGRVDRCAALFKSGKLKSGGRLLDVGGGIGDLGPALAGLFDEVVVVDMSVLNLSVAEAKGNSTELRDVDSEGLPGEDGSFDCVVALDFIEHLVDPEEFVRECSRVLKPGGETFVNTPNIRFWRHIETLRHKGRFPRTSGDREVWGGGHLAYFARGDLEEMFSRAGFSSWETFRDEEGYEEPPAYYPSRSGCRVEGKVDQLLHIQELVDFGCPNLLFKATKKS